MLRSKRDRGSLHFERLETRNLLHGSDVVVTDTHVIAGHDVVPRFAANAEFVATGSGDWSDPSVWNKRSVPGVGATVQIPHGKSITYDVSSRVELDAIEVSGRLDFDPTVNTSLWLGELMVMPDGVLTVGTHDQPISPSVQAKIVFTDTSDASGRSIKTGTVGSPGIDPEQWGTGLLVFGHVEMVGQEKTTYMRLSKEPVQGENVLELSDPPVGWVPGDILVLPDTNPNWNSNRIEELVIQSVEGRRVRLKTNLSVDHFGAKDAQGAIRFLPHVGNLSRNIIVTSENPTGLRGHTAFFAQADVDMQYVRFSELGRTTASEIDSTTFASDGSVLKIGSNQNGRYSVHLHHLYGPENETNTGYQFKLVGNVIDHGLRWGIALHGASFGLVSKNFVYDMVGAGLVAEDGTEAYNAITENFFVKTSGKGNFKEGLAGEAVWLRGPLNDVRGNIVANSNRAAFNYFSQNLPDTIARAQFRGAFADVDFEQYFVQNTPYFGFADNEVYASMSALDSWENQPEQRQFIQGLTAWNTADNNFVLSSYLGSNLVVDGLNVIGNFAGVNPSRKQTYQPIPSVGFRAVRQAENVTIQNSALVGLQTGIMTPEAAVERMVVQDSTIQAYVGIKVGRLTRGSPTGLEPDRGYGSLVIDNTRFVRMPENSVESQQYSIFLDFEISEGRRSNLLATNEVFVLRHNGISTSNYRVYYLEQAPNYIVPQSSTNGNLELIGSPEPGLTNLELWRRYGVAIGGAVAPSREIDGDNGEAALGRGLALGIRGLVFPIAPPIRPLVNAGKDLTIHQDEVAVLGGSWSQGAQGDWSKFSGAGVVNFSEFRNGSSRATFSEPGVYVLRLTAQLGSVRVSDDVVVTVLPRTGPFNLPPRVNAGDDQSIPGNVVKLVGTVGDDGKPFGTLRHAWRLVSGPGAVSISDANALSTSVTFQNKGRYILELWSTDGATEATDSVVVVVERVLPVSPMLAHWRLDSMTNNLTQDDSVHELHGVVTDASVVPGKNGSALELHGGHIAMPQTDLMMPANAFTIAGWITHTAGMPFQPVFSWDGGSWDAFKLSVADTDAKAIVAVEVTTEKGVNRFETSLSARLIDKWTHVALTFSGSNGGEACLYVNGELILRRGELGQEINYKSNGNRRFYIGFDSNRGKSNAFRGKVDDFYAFNVALDEAALRELVTQRGAGGAREVASGFILPSPLKPENDSLLSDTKMVAAGIRLSLGTSLEGAPAAASHTTQVRGLDARMMSALHEAGEAVDIADAEKGTYDDLVDELALSFFDSSLQRH